MGVTYNAWYKRKGKAALCRLENPCVREGKPIKGARSLLRIFFTFSWVSIVALGGGYSMLPIYRRELTRLGVVNSEDVLTIITRAQSLPGPIAVNFAVVMGSKLGGIPGAFAAASGVIFPPVVVILTLGKLLLEHRELSYLSGFLYGVRIVVVAMLGSLILDMLKRYKRSVWEYTTLGLAVVALFWKMPGLIIFIVVVLVDLFWRRLGV